MNQFQKQSENLKKNIAEIKSTIKNPDLLLSADRQIFERLIYLFQSVIKTVIDLGNNIIINNDFRNPLNTADVFISLAENNVISPAIVPGLKKAALVMPKMKNYTHTELVDIMQQCIGDFNRCLHSFTEYFKKKKDEVGPCT